MLLHISLSSGESSLPGVLIVVTAVLLYSFFAYPKARRKQRGEEARKERIRAARQAGRA